MELRYCVKKFAETMEKKLRQNDHKGGWNNEEHDFLWSKLVEEISEFRMQCYKRSKKNDKKILNEAADVANIIMMIADICTWKTSPLQKP